MKKQAALAIATLAAGLVIPTAVLPAPSASAQCPEAGETFYSVSSVNTRMPFKGLPVFKNGRGGVLSVSKDFTSSVSYQVTAGAESEVGAVLAKAKVSISASIAKSNSSTVTNNYTHPISATKFGNAQYVSWGKKVSYRKYRINTTCTGTTTLATGSIKFPTNAEGWYYWETTS